MTKLRGCSVELEGSLKVDIQDTLVFMICLISLSKYTECLTNSFFTKLLTVYQKCSSKASFFRHIRALEENTMKFAQIGHTTSHYGQLFFSKTMSAWNGLAFAEIPSLAVCRSNFL